jgi:hypothetical protein
MAFAIFAGLVIFSIIFLYTKTADRWNWKKIVFWCLGVLVVMIVLVMVAVFKDSFMGDPEKTGKYKGFIQSYKGLAIGGKLSDAEFKYGVWKKQSSTASEDSDVYINSENNLGLYTDKGKNIITAVVLLCTSGNYDTFNGIGCSANGEDLERRFGKDLKILCRLPDKDGWEDAEPTRAYDVSKYGTRYVLVQNKIRYIGFMPESSFTSKRWGECK